MVDDMQNSEAEEIKAARKCTFCNKDAIAVVKGYPVCEEHAAGMYETETSGAPKLK